MLVVNPGAGQPMIRTGVNVGYSDEFRDRETNQPLLSSLAELSPEQGEPGVIVSEEAGVDFTGEASTEPLAAVDLYRRDLPPAVASQPIWPLLVLLGSLLFVGDVFVRRVQIGFGWAVTAWEWTAQRVFGREGAAPEPQTMARLRSRKAKVQESLSRQSATRFEIDEEAPPTKESLLDEIKQTSAGPKPKPTSGKKLAEEKPKEEESYTSRLLKAKRDATRDRDKK